ncbi:MAG TPA: hypothetical protein VHY91_26210 [Pirellulales bacterium]|jgi:hypothetical protein|nr:hypothetical protein [Pirellulales bacterium]
MVIVNRAVMGLLMRRVTRDVGWSNNALLIADGLLRLNCAEITNWDAHLVGLQRADDSRRVAECRRRIQDGRIDRAAWTFEMMSDAWCAYLAISSPDGPGASPRAVVVELLDTFEVLDCGDVISSYEVDPIPCLPPGLPHMRIDLSKIK